MFEMHRLNFIKNEELFIQNAIHLLKLPAAKCNKIVCAPTTLHAKAVHVFNAHLPTIKANLTTKTLNVEYICTGVAVLICSSAIFKASNDVLHRYID